MAQASAAIEVYVEQGAKRCFAGALAWPGWCRVGRDESAALEALADYGPRYAAVLAPAGVAFTSAADVSALQVVERLPGGASTDFGAPEAIPAADAAPLDGAELDRLGAILRACWAAFDAGRAAAVGVELRKGPRGGGRDLDALSRHVLGAEQSYVTRLGWKRPQLAGASLDAELAGTRQAALDALAAGARGELPARGPRGGAIWPPRYFVRRAAWHVLDHLWELEDRAAP